MEDRKTAEIRFDESGDFPECKTDSQSEKGLSRVTEDDETSLRSKLSGWMDVQSPSENNVPKLKWIEYFESIESHSDVCNVDLETGEIQNFDVNFFDESEKEFLRECVQKALTGKLTRGKYKGKTLNDLCDIQYLSYWQHLINVYGKNLCVDLIATIFFTHVCYSWKQNARIINSLLVDLTDLLPIKKFVLILVKFPCTDDENHKRITFRTIDILFNRERKDSRSAESILSESRRHRQGLKIHDD